MKTSPSPVDARLPLGPVSRWYGLYSAQVTDIVDPDGTGRVKVRLAHSPEASGAVYEAWARLATFMAGNRRGSWFVPEVNDEVIVGFEAGDSRLPYVLGSLWSHQNPPPVAMDGFGANNRKVLRSRSGVQLTLDDQDKQANFLVETPGGQRITLRDGPGMIEINDGNGNLVKLETGGITIAAAAKVSISASVVAISAGMVQVDAGSSKFSGVVQCDTLLANSVVSASYSPGAGNIF